MAKNLIPDDVSQYRTQEYWEWRYSQDSQADAVVEGDAGSVAGSGSGAEAEVVAATEE